MHGVLMHGDDEQGVQHMEQNTNLEKDAQRDVPSVKVSSFLSEIESQYLLISGNPRATLSIFVVQQTEMGFLGEMLKEIRKNYF